MPKTNLDRRERMAQQTRGEILTAARRLFAERGYTATSINDIAQEADVAVQTIYARLGSKRAQIRVTRGVQERCGDIIGALFSAAGAEPELADAVAEGQRRHREGARITIDKILRLNGLHDHEHPERAQALLALSTSHEAWRELIHSYKLDWDDAEAWLTTALARALLKPPTRSNQAPPPAKKQVRRHQAKQTRSSPWLSGKVADFEPAIPWPGV